MVLFSFVVTVALVLPCLVLFVPIAGGTPQTLVQTNCSLIVDLEERIKCEQKKIRKPLQGPLNPSLRDPSPTLMPGREK